MLSSTANRIIDAALEMTQMRGYHAFSYRDIAKQIGIRTASIHYYFPAKADLAEALVIRTRTAFEQTLQHIDAECLHPAEKLQGFLDIFRRTFAGGDRLCPFCMLVTCQDTLEEKVREQLRMFFRRTEAWLAGVLDQGNASGELAVAGDTLTAAKAIVAVLEGAMLAARIGGDPAGYQTVTNYVIDQFIKADHRR